MCAVIYRFVAVGRCAGEKVFTDKKENITDKYMFFGLSVIGRRDMEEKKVGRNKSGRFTKGNNFAKGEGSPSKYKKEYAEKLIEYFSVPKFETLWKRKYYTNGQVKEEEPITYPPKYPTFEGFAKVVGVTSGTLQNWREKYPSFNEAYERALDMQKDILITNSLGGLYNGNFAKFIASAQFGMVEKTEQKITGIDGIDLNIEVLKSDDEAKAK